MEKKKWARAKNEFGLTPKQETFVQEYLIDLNAVKAAQRAGYAKSTSAEASQLFLKDEIIAARIEMLTNERAKKTGLTAEYVISGLMRIAGVDVRQLHDGEGKLLAIHELPDDVAHSISSIDIYKDFTEGVEIGETKRFKLHDKLKAFELLGRHLKLFTDKVELSGQVSLAEKLERARKRKG